MSNRNLALTALFASLYSVLVLALTGVSFEVVQVRIADSLIPLSIIFGWPVIFGVSVGCIIGNIASPMPSILTDVTLGALANFLASFFAWKINRMGKINWKSNFLGCSAATITITFIVGTYLAVLTTTEFWVWWLGIGIGSIISINIIGFILVQGLIKARIS